MSIHNYSISFLIIMKDEGPKVFKLKLTLPGVSQKYTSSDSTSEGTTIFDKILGIVF